MAQKLKINVEKCCSKNVQESDGWVKQGGKGRENEVRRERMEIGKRECSLCWKSDLRD